MPNTLNLWLELWHFFSAKGDPQAVFDRIVAQYSAPSRKYHDMSHLEHVLLELQSVKFLFCDNLYEYYVVMLALFFHDAIYDPTVKDNEIQSALLAKQIVKEVGLPDELGEKVAQYIEATDHSQMSADFFIQIICDIDLSPLGCPAEQYEANTAKIRQEYQMFSKEEFLDGRTKFTESFLARPSIYQTWYFQDKYERRAWENLVVSLAWLPQCPWL